MNAFESLRAGVTVSRFLSSSRVVDVAAVSSAHEAEAGTPLAHLVCTPKPILDHLNQVIPHVGRPGRAGQVAFRSAVRRARSLEVEQGCSPDTVFRVLEHERL